MSEREDAGGHRRGCLSIKEPRTAQSEAQCQRRSFLVGSSAMTANLSSAAEGPVVLDQIERFADQATGQVGKNCQTSVSATRRIRNSGALAASMTSMLHSESCLRSRQIATNEVAAHADQFFPGFIAALELACVGSAGALGIPHSERKQRHGENPR
jgi:hypothetical protein